MILSPEYFTDLIITVSKELEPYPKAKTKTFAQCFKKELDSFLEHEMQGFKGINELRFLDLCHRFANLPTANKKSAKLLKDVGRQISDIEISDDTLQGIKEEIASRKLKNKLQPSDETIKLWQEKISGLTETLADIDDRDACERLLSDLHESVLEISSVDTLDISFITETMMDLLSLLTEAEDREKVLKASELLSSFEAQIEAHSDLSKADAAALSQLMQQKAAFELERQDDGALDTSQNLRSPTLDELEKRIQTVETFFKSGKLESNARDQWNAHIHALMNQFRREANEKYQTLTLLQPPFSSRDSVLLSEIEGFFESLKEIIKLWSKEMEADNSGHYECSEEVKTAYKELEEQCDTLAESIVEKSLTELKSWVDTFDQRIQNGESIENLKKTIEQKLSSIERRYGKSFPSIINKESKTLIKSLEKYADSELQTQLFSKIKKMELQIDLIKEKAEREGVIDFESLDKLRKLLREQKKTGEVFAFDQIQSKSTQAAFKKRLANLEKTFEKGRLVKELLGDRDKKIKAIIDKKINESKEAMDLVKKLRENHPEKRLDAIKIAESQFESLVKLAEQWRDEVGIAKDGTVEDHNKSTAIARKSYFQLLKTIAQLEGQIGALNVDGLRVAVEMLKAQIDTGVNIKRLVDEIYERRDKIRKKHVKKLNKSQLANFQKIDKEINSLSHAVSLNRAFNMIKELEHSIEFLKGDAKSSGQLKENDVLRLQESLNKAKEKGGDLNLEGIKQGSQKKDLQKRIKQLEKALNDGALLQELKDITDDTLLDQNNSIEKEVKLRIKTLKRCKRKFDSEKEMAHTALDSIFKKLISVSETENKKIHAKLKLAAVKAKVTDLSLAIKTVNKEFKSGKDIGAMLRIIKHGLDSFKSLYQPYADGKRLLAFTQVEKAATQIKILLKYQHIYDRFNKIYMAINKFKKLAALDGKVDEKEIKAFFEDFKKQQTNGNSLDPSVILEGDVRQDLAKQCQTIDNLYNSGTLLAEIKELQAKYLAGVFKQALKQSRVVMKGVTSFKVGGVDDISENLRDAETQIKTLRNLRDQWRSACGYDASNNFLGEKQDSLATIYMKLVNEITTIEKTIGGFLINLIEKDLSQLDGLISSGQPIADNVENIHKTRNGIADLKLQGMTSESTAKLNKIDEKINSLQDVVHQSKAYIQIKKFNEEVQRLRTEALEKGHFSPNEISRLSAKIQESKLSGDLNVKKIANQSVQESLSSSITELTDIFDKNVLTNELKEMKDQFVIDFLQKELTTATKQLQVLMRLNGEFNENKKADISDSETMLLHITKLNSKWADKVGFDSEGNLIDSQRSSSALQSVFADILDIGKKFRETLGQLKVSELEQIVKKIRENVKDASNLSALFVSISKVRNKIDGSYKEHLGMEVRQRYSNIIEELSNLNDAEDRNKIYQLFKLLQSKIDQAEQRFKNATFPSRDSMIDGVATELTDLLASANLKSIQDKEEQLNLTKKKKELEEIVTEKIASFRTMRNAKIEEELGRTYNQASLVREKISYKSPDDFANKFGGGKDKAAKDHNIKRKNYMDEAKRMREKLKELVDKYGRSGFESYRGDVGFDQIRDEIYDLGIKLDAILKEKDDDKYTSSVTTEQPKEETEKKGWFSKLFN